MQKITEVKEEHGRTGFAYDSGDESDQLWNQESEPESEGEESGEEDVDFQEFNKQLLTGIFKDIKFGVSKEIDEWLKELKDDTPDIPDPPEIQQENPPPYRMPRMKFGSLLPKAGGGKDGK